MFGISTLLSQINQSIDNITKQSIDKDCKTIVNNLLENDYVMERIGDTLDEQIQDMLKTRPYLYII